MEAVPAKPGQSPQNPAQLACRNFYAKNCGVRRNESFLSFRDDRSGADLLQVAVYFPLCRNYKPERGAMWTYLTTNRPFGDRRERMLRGLIRKVVKGSVWG